jgi:hypothetical protein
MRILMTQRSLMQWAGSEMFTIEVSKELNRRGHQVAIFCPRIGDPARIIYASGVAIKSRLDELPWEPEIIHGQHHLQTAAALSFFTDVPAVYYCHGLMPWVERVLSHPRIRNYVMMCEWMVSPVATEFGIPRDCISAIPNFVNTTRFSEVRKPPDRLRRALLFGGGLPANELVRLERACSAEGLSLDKIGYAYKNPQERPESLLLEYDLVFAVGRCAIEAISCGCAVIPIVPGQGGHLVTTENFSSWVYSNFIPIYGTSSTRIDVEWLKSELSRYSPETTSEVTAMLRASHNLSGGVGCIEEIYEKTLRDHASNKKEEPREFAPYLEKISMEVDAMWEQTNNIKKVKNKLREVTQRLEESNTLVKSHRNRVKRLEARLSVAKQELRSVRSPRLWRLSKVMRTLGSFFRESGPGFTVGRRGRDPLN